MPPLMFGGWQSWSVNSSTVGMAVIPKPDISARFWIAAVLCRFRAREGFEQL
jgi:hypothetical protein